MDNSKLHTAQNGQVNIQSAIDDSEDDYRPEKSVEDMVRYVRQVGKLNQANRQLVAGIERAKFNQTA